MDRLDPGQIGVPAYILGITRQIWEDRQVSTLRQYYADDIPVRAPLGVVVGNEAVIAATLATLAEFPDRQLLGEDVLWTGSTESGFLSSHRIVSTATHAGHGTYGPATGTTLRYRIIADCAIRGVEIYDEWIVRDQSAIVRQLGLDPRAYVLDQIEREGGPETASRPLDPESDPPARYTGTGNDDEWAVRYAETLRAVMSGDIAAVRTTYDRAAHLELPGGRTGHGWVDAEHFWLRLRGAFPNAAFEIHHQMGAHEPLLAPRAALRWSLTGSHTGWGPFGEPTGAPAHIMGLSHAEFGPHGIRREYVLIDEVAIWKQILLYRS
ncbi:ester cyclase [soil metagenome]